jgi:hypothetical protein
MKRILNAARDLVAKHMSKPIPGVRSVSLEDDSQE